MNKERNFRDLGGYINIHGQKIKKGLYYRSAALHLFNDEELEEIKALHLKAILDLRSKAEANRNPDPILDGVKYLRHSGVVSKGGEEIDFSINGMLKKGEEASKQYAKISYYYSNIPFANESLKVFFNEIKTHNLPILFHCFTGKDRTGAAAILLLALLEIPKDTILEDYLLSNEAFKERIEREVSKGHAYSDDLLTDKLLRIHYGVIREIGEKMYDNVLKHYGNFENYFKEEYGFTDDDIKRIREFSLE